jgi:hypothetical protein
MTWQSVQTTSLLASWGVVWAWRERGSKMKRVKHTSEVVARLSIDNSFVLMKITVNFNNVSFYRSMVFALCFYTCNKKLPYLIFFGEEYYFGSPAFYIFRF